jgi:uncharacterized damage-inducible protein DinB
MSMAETSITILDELYRYNHWANWKILELCQGLSDEQLDQPREMGFGSLRNTVFHILAAEEVWLERWTQVPPRPFPLDAQGMTIQKIAERLDRVNERRSEWLDAIGESGLSQSCQYQDSKGVPYTNPLRELLIHVANHGIHHRAQALSFLKSFGRTRRGGIDHLFFRLANPAIDQEPEAMEAMRQFGLECGTGESPSLAWDASLINRYFAYGDWANKKLFAIAQNLTDEQLDHDFNMGMGSIRKTLLHLYDAEKFWSTNWIEGKNRFENLPTATSVHQVCEWWNQVINSRNQFLQKQDETSATRVLLASFGGPEFAVAMIESMVQVCCHGTHHRAQLANMLRHSGHQVPAIDYVVWVRE